MTPHWLQWFRPRRRWFQYRLRTLFVLMTLVCVWLSYNAWRYHREQEIVAGIMARDSEAVVVWAGPSWLKWLGEDSVPTIFRRVQEITFDGDIEIREDFSELQLQKLSALEALTLYFGMDCGDEKEARLTAVFGRLLPGIRLNILSEGSSDDENDFEGYWEQRIMDYLKHPTDIKAAEICAAFGPPWPCSSSPFLTEPDQIAMAMPSVGLAGVSGEEPLFEQLLSCRHRELQIVAARNLWGRLSCKHAHQVIALAGMLPHDADTATELKSIVEADLAPQRILAELRKPIADDTVWWAWLAALRPHPTLVPALMDLAKEKRPLLEVIYALWQAKDPRSLVLLFKILNECEDYRARCLAAKAIGEIGGTSVEVQLLDALRRNTGAPKDAILITLAEVGTARSLPELRKSADANSSNSSAWLSAQAVKAIVKRSRPHSSPVKKAA
jgi:hypothetical protein